ncbi:general substrate transporter [Eremomyces bilateralis CBS 781.70]|uniref:General substrate transporter n=1 Tax=Eremomyces bilateralis CBS 781.70 TaxID=1392243 RepID=A0A6G1FXV0_9PEZI|nr:general substrate transporter [Eremomyces bilateralis CBS 781.70]KAF1810496.1 general substrate transporter [Eremomyces bilateralis CBS 781.70]
MANPESKHYIIPRPRNWYNFIVALFVAFGSLSYGYASSISAATIGQPSWYDYMGLEQDSSYTNSIIGVINCIYAVGGVLGCIYNMWAAEYFGRKISIQMACVMAIFGAALMTGSQNVPMFVVSRVIMGFAIGILVTLVPLYQSEVSPAESRGLMVGLHGVLIGFSYALTGLVSYACSFAPYGEFQWRFPLAVQMIWPLILFIGMFFLPYSPRWLLSQGREEEAWTITKRLHASRHDPEDSYALAEFRQMREQIAFEKTQSAAGPWAQAKYAWSRPSFRKRLGLGILVQAGNQATGALVINNYQTVFYNRLGISGRLPLLLVGCFNLITVPGNLINGLLVDHVGRRKFVLTGIVALTIIVSVEAALTARFADTGSDNKVGLGFGVAFIFMFPVFYSVCLDATMYLIPAEIFPMIIRSFGISFSIMGQWIATAVLLGAAPTAFENIKFGFWIVLIAGSVVYGVLVYFFLPETKGMTLEDISILFGDPVEVTFAKAMEKSENTTEGYSHAEEGDSKDKHQALGEIF